MIQLLSNPLVRLLGSLSAVGLIVGGIYLGGKSAGVAQQETILLKDNIATMQRVFERERGARLQDIAFVEASKERLNNLTTKISELNEYVETLEDRDLVCLDGDDTDRLRDIWID